VGGKPLTLFLYGGTIMDMTKMFKELAEFVMEELSDAQKYAKKALCLKGDNKKLADMFYTLSVEEMSHMNREHAAMKEIASADLEKYGLAFELVTDHATEWAKEIKVMQDMYRE
jgi:hypothetical protein